jgi:hypothetical protein
VSAVEITVSEEKAAFYCELGNAVTQWALIEYYLFRFLSGFMSGELLGSIAHGFFAIQLFQQKIAFVNGLIERHIKNNEHLEAWHALSKRLNRAASQRNKLVHRQLILFPQAAYGRRVALVEWLAEPAVTASGEVSPHNDAICIVDVARIKQLFSDRLRDLINLAHKLRSQPEPFPESPEQPQAPPPFETLLAQIRKELEPPQPASAD